MTDVLPLKRALLDEWLADTQNHIFHIKKRKTNTPLSPSLSLPSFLSPSSSVVGNDDHYTDDRSLLSLPTIRMTNQTTNKKTTRKVARLDCLERKVDRLLDDNNQLKQCADVLEREHQLAMTETEAKEARIIALEKQLAAAHKLLLLKVKNEDDSLLD